MGVRPRTFVGGRGGPAQRVLHTSHLTHLQVRAECAYLCRGPGVAADRIGQLLGAGQALDRLRRKREGGSLNEEGIQIADE